MQGSGKESSSAEDARPTRHRLEGEYEATPEADDSAEEIAARVRRECAAQGVPEKIEDPAVLTNIVTLAFDGSATPSRTP
jgi:hypothetical protein